jgi:hypothetical protein
VPVKAYAVSSDGSLNVTASSVSQTDKNGIVVVAGLDSTKQYDLVVQTTPFTHHNERDVERWMRSAIGIATGYVLTAVGDGTSTWAAALVTTNYTNITVSGTATLANLVVTGVSTLGVVVASGANHTFVYGTGGAFILKQNASFKVQVTTSQMNLFSGVSLFVSDNIDVVGTLAATGAATLRDGLNVGSATGAATGDIKTSGYLRMAQLALIGTRIEETLTDSDSIGPAFNYYGYKEGVTRFRNVTFYDGKTAMVAYMSGSNKGFYMYGDMYRDNTKILGTQGAAVADATDAASTTARLNDLLARCRAHGLIAT